jgi:hypothetical protein
MVKLNFTIIFAAKYENEKKLRQIDYGTIS